MTELRAHKLNDLHLRLMQLEGELRRQGMDTEAILITETISEMQHLRNTLAEIGVSLGELRAQLDRPPFVRGRMNSKWN